jgi:peptidyl-prolyl cis-trans isomerase SurA
MVKSVFSFLVALLASATLFGQGKVIDKVVAQVGDNIILLSDLEGQKTQAKQSGLEVGPHADCGYLEELMYQNLLVNQAELDSIVISDEQVDAEMESRLRIIENQMRNTRDENGQPMTLEKFYGKTKTQIKEEFKTVIRKRLQAQEVEHKITQDISVSPREVEQFFNKQPVDSLPFINTQLAFQQIAIFPTITKDDKALALKKLQDIRSQIIDNKRDFETMARIYSMDEGSKRDGGRIEATRGMMVKPFEATAYNLKPGEISDVFETEYGYHIMKMGLRHGDDYIVYHILIYAEPSRQSLDDASKKMQECFQALQSNSITWEDAVKKYSNDPNTKENHGIITNPITGEQTWDIEAVNQVDPQMFQLTDVLEKGQFTYPTIYKDFMERKDAWRIVRLMERTTPHRANLTDDYVLIRTAAESQKKQQAILNWTKSRISGAYIRIDDEYTGCPFQNVWIPKPN